MLWKSLGRTIRKSLGRYLAILSIIALGVGFFAGLRVTEQAMIQTADDYLDEMNLYDFRLISTLGLTEDDVAEFSALNDISGAYGAVSADLIYKADDDADAVFHARSLIDGVNGLDLAAGRLPMKADECALDAKFYDESYIGKRIVLSGSNDEDTLDTFTYDEYIVVGLANASEYINFERGTTSLAGGVVSGYIYLLPDGFDTEYFTELFLTIDTDERIYSNGYDAALDDVRSSVETLLDERAEIRFDKICSDAKKEIREAQAELNDKLDELENAQREIDDGWEDYFRERDDAEEKLADTKKQLDTARRKLNKARGELEAAKLSPAAQMPEVQAQLEASEAELKKNERAYRENRDTYEQAILDAEAEFEKAEAKLRDAQSEINDAQPEIEDAKEEIADAWEELNDIEPATTYALDRSSNIGYASLENDTAIVLGIAKVFPLFFFLVAALVCITTMTRMVSEQRGENGILKSLGYGEAAITGQYLFYAGSASAIGCVVGFLVGSKAMPIALWEIYQIMYSINRPIDFVLDWRLFILCGLLYMTSALGATWLVCRRDLVESAASLLRPKSPKAGKRILLERVGFIWRHVKFLHKISIRNILRYKKRMVMMIIGIGGCTALLLTGFGIRDTIKPVVNYQYNEIELYDASVTFADELDETASEKFTEETASVTDKMVFARSVDADVIVDNATKAINLVVFNDAPDGFIDLHEGGRKIDFPKNGSAVINYRFAVENSLVKGDELTVLDDDGNKFTVTVADVFDNYLYDYLFISAETYTAYTGEAPKQNTAYVNFNADEDIHAAGAVLLGADNVAAISICKDMEERVGSMLESLDYVVLIVLVCAGALAFIVLYNLTNITITERTREIATLKVLGFYLNEQNAYVFRENMVLTAISAVCGIPMGLLLLDYVMAQIKISTFYFGCRLAPVSYVYAILITLIFTVIVDFVLTFKTARIDMAEAMKAVE